VDEIVGFAEAMRAAAVRVTVAPTTIDIVGTGGSRVDPFNISTTSSIVAVAAGASVAKHGNRAATGNHPVLLGSAASLPISADRHHCGSRAGHCGTHLTSLFERPAQPV